MEVPGDPSGCAVSLQVWDEQPRPQLFHHRAGTGCTGLWDDPEAGGAEGEAAAAAAEPQAGAVLQWEVPETGAHQAGRFVVSSSGWALTAPGQILMNWRFLLLTVPFRASLPCALLQLQGAALSLWHQHFQQLGRLRVEGTKATGLLLPLVT